MASEDNRIRLVTGGAALIGVIVNSLALVPYVLIPCAIWLGFFGFFWIMLGDHFSFIRIHVAEARDLISALVRGKSNMSQSLIWQGLVNTWSNVLSAMFAGWAICALVFDKDPYDAFVGFGLSVVLVVVGKWIAITLLKRRG